MLRRRSQKRVSYFVQLLNIASQLATQLPILSRQLLIFITFQSCFLSIIYAKVSYSANDLAIDTTTYTYICIYMFPLHIISSGFPRQCAYASSGYVQKKITLYRNFSRNLNFKNIVLFFKRTCCLSLNHYQRIYNTTLTITPLVM